MAACQPTGALPARGTGTELVLLRPGDARDLERGLASFGERLALVLSSGERCDEAEWAARFARAASAPHELVPELAHGAESAEALAARAWPALERRLEHRCGRVLAVLPLDVLRACLARGLGFPPAHAARVRVDPGHAVLLRDEPLGLVLRRSNVLSLDERSGTALPSGASPPAGNAG
jgi:hypothetical protein